MRLSRFPRRMSISEEQLNLYPNDPVINQASTNLVNTIGANLNADHQIRRCHRRH